MLGTAGGILYFLKWLKHEPYYVIYGDNYSNVDLSNIKVYHDSVDSDFTIALHRVKNIQQSGYVKLDKAGKVNKFIEKPKIDNIKGGWVNSGFYIINPGVINALIKEKSDFSYDIIPWLVRRKKNIYGYRIKNKLWAIDTPELFFSAKNELNIT